MPLYRVRLMRRYAYSARLRSAAGPLLSLHSRSARSASHRKRADAMTMKIDQRRGIGGDRSIDK